MRKKRLKKGKKHENTGGTHFLIVKRKHLTIAAAAMACAVIFAAVNYPMAISASVATRQLPVYCVERDEKMCSISFDAAWGDGKMRQCVLP